VSDGLSGLSPRSISQELGISVEKSFSLYSKALEKFPIYIDIARLYCSKFCGILLVDRKNRELKGMTRKFQLFTELII